MIKEDDMVNEQIVGGQNAEFDDSTEEFKGILIALLARSSTGSNEAATPN